MISERLYEDVLDDIDEIKPDVSEEYEDKYPIFRDGYAYTILVSGQNSINKDIRHNVMPDVLKVYLDKYCNDYRIAVISSKEDLAEFTAETGLNSIDDDDDWPHTVVQFNASRKNIFRLIFWIFSVGTYFIRFVRSGNKWKTYTQGDVFDIYELVRGAHIEIGERFVDQVVIYMTEFGRDEKDTKRLPDFETYDYIKKIIETYNERFRKR